MAGLGQLLALGSDGGEQLGVVVDLAADGS